VGRGITIVGRRALFALSLTAVTAAVAGCGGERSETPTIPSVASAGATQPTIGRNVVRLPGISATDLSSAAVLAAYDPRSGAKPPEGWVLVSQDDWRQTVVASQFAARPVSAGVLAIDREFIPTAAGDLLARIRPTGFPQSSGLEVVVLDHVGNDVYVDLQDLGLKPTVLTGAPDELAAKLVPFRGGWARAYSDAIVVVSSEARDYALPAAAWSAYSGDTVAFVHRDSVPRATREVLAQRQKLRLRRPAIYVIGPEDVVSEKVAAQLARYGPVHRIAGADAVETSVALARYHDPSTGFGWGMRRGPASVSLVNREHWSDAIAAMTLAATGPQAPLLLTDSADSLPAPVENYLHQLRGRKPSQAYVMGGTSSIGEPVMSALDRLLDARD
jgi:hypothetical protein